MLGSWKARDEPVQCVAYQSYNEGNITINEASTASGLQNIGYVGAEEIRPTIAVSKEEQSIPVENHDVQAQSSVWGVTFNLMSTTLGAGLLSLPYTVKIGGWIALGMYVLVPIISAYTGKILIDCLYDSVETRGRVKVRFTYEEVGEACWPRHGRKLVTIILQVTLFLIATSFLVLAGSFLNDSFPDAPLTKRLWILVAAGFVFPTVFLKNVSQIAWLSLAGVLAILVPVAILVWYGIDHSSQWTIDSIPSWNTEGAFISINVISFAYGMHGLLIDIEGSMKKKEKFNGIMFAVFAFSAILNLVISLFGFLTFTQTTQDVFTNNLPTGVISYVVNVCIGIKVTTSYALPIFVVIQCIDGSFLKVYCLSKMPQTAWYIALRLFFVSLSVATAAFLPQFALVLAFIGSIGASSLIFMLPAIFHVILKRPNLSYISISVNALAFLFGFFSGSLGLFFSSKEVVNIYTN